jgi:hypothetical protein
MDANALPTPPAAGPAAVSGPPTVPRPDKAILLGSFYSYLGGRIDSIGRRAAFMMALLGSFLGFVSSPIVRSEASVAAKRDFLLAHPSLAVGIVAMVVLLLAEMARIKPSKDLLARIAFTEEDVKKLHDYYVESPVDVLFGDMIRSARVVGGFLRKKVFLYNTGAALFTFAVVLYVLGY